MSKESQRLKHLRGKTLPKDRVIRLDERGYYSGPNPYTPMPRDQASKLNRPDAESVRRSLRKLGYYSAAIEAAK